MNLKSKSIALGLVVTTLVSASACKRNVKTDETESKVDKQEEIVEFAPEPEFNPVNSLNESLYDANIDYQAVINKFLSSDYSEREALKDDYFRALYMLLLNSGVDMNIYLEELNNMCIVGLVPTELPEDLWNKFFSNLIAVSNNYNSLFEMFGDFAHYVHSLSCLEEHSENEYGCYTCPELEKEYKLIR